MDTGRETAPEAPAPYLAPQTKGYLFVLSGAVCISFAGFFVKDSPIDVSMVAFYRLLFGAAALFVVAALRRERMTPTKASPVFFIVLSGLMFCCDLLVWHESITYVGPGIATILGNFQVLILALYGVVFLKERLTTAQKIAMPLALVGLALLLGVHENSLPPHVVKGTLLCLLSAMFYSVYILALRRTQGAPSKLPPVTNMAWVSLLASLFVGLFCLGRGISFAIPDTKTFIILAVLGILCQSLGWLLLSIGLPLLPPFRAGLIMLAQPALAFIWDMLFYGANSGIVNILGAVIAIAAIGMGILSSQRPKTRPLAPGEPAIRASMHPAGESARLTRRIPKE